jgi:hypothetical protein
LIEFDHVEEMRGTLRETFVSVWDGEHAACGEGLAHDGSGVGVDEGVSTAVLYTVVGAIDIDIGGRAFGGAGGVVSIGIHG